MPAQHRLLTIQMSKPLINSSADVVACQFSSSAMLLVLVLLHAFPTCELLLHIVMSESTKEDRPFFFHADFCYIYGSNIFTTGAGAQVPD